MRPHALDSMRQQRAHPADRQHDVEREHTADPFPIDLIVFGAEAFDEAVHDGFRQKRFRAKRVPLRVMKTRQNKNPDPRSDSIGTGF